MIETPIANDSAPRSLFRYWRYAAAFALGGLLVVDFLIHHWWITLENERPWFLGVLFASLVTFAGICWPLDSYGRTWALSAANAVGVGVGFALIEWHRYSIGFAQNIGVILGAFVGGFVAGMLRFGLPLTFVVWCRRKWWPVRTPGFCVKCGYCLRGLTSLRCPECGTELDPPRLLSSQTSGNRID